MNFLLSEHTFHLTSEVRYSLSRNSSENTYVPGGEDKGGGPRPRLDRVGCAVPSPLVPQQPLNPAMLSVAG